ncbi:DNA-directed RNA polymerase I subunit RPA34 [Scleropages formosus]|uniref:RNA polymerase I subunit G n=1 Tax=Scleropages formosus TaxID=113540 RepID=A0A8C9R0U5_SCLFO|nr:DNA-directed RNA polymerase I subunit RPA34 [Scleropages formosus]
MSAGLRDVSSSGEDSDSESRRRKPAGTRYRCPADFISCAYRPCSSALLENICGADVELCLIKAPASFDPNSFSGLKIPLKGLQTLQAKAGNLQTATYNVLSNPAGAVDMQLLTASSSLNGMVCGPRFTRIVNICERFGDSLGKQTFTALPAAPAPCIPEGLKQRFHPFGSGSATATASIPSSRKQMGLHEAEGRKKKDKKKKKKNKAIKMEEEEKPVWEEDSSQSLEVLQNLEGEAVVTSKKRRKKDKEKGKKNMEGLQTGFCLKEERNLNL